MRVLPLVHLRGRRVRLVLVRVVVVVVPVLPRIRNRLLIGRVVRKHQADVPLPGRGGFRLRARRVIGARTRLGVLLVTACQRARRRGVHVVHQRLVDSTAFGNERAAHSMRRAVRALGRPRIDGDLRLQEGAETVAFPRARRRGGRGVQGDLHHLPRRLDIGLRRLHGRDTEGPRGSRRDRRAVRRRLRRRETRPHRGSTGRASAEGPRARPARPPLRREGSRFSTTRRWHHSRTLGQPITDLPETDGEDSANENAAIFPKRRSARRARGASTRRSLLCTRAMIVFLG